MLKLALSLPTDAPCRVLCLGSHSDDIEIGCGGTILQLAEDVPELEVYWVVFGSDDERAREAAESAACFLERAKTKTVVVKDFRASFFPFAGETIKEHFEQLKHAFTPDVVFTHYRHDLHQDHQLISQLTWNTFRNHFILEYEIPKYDGDLGAPNVFMHLDETVCRRKIEYVLSSFKSQRDKHWFEEDTFWALMRLRGMESNAPSRYAEAFYCRKAVLAAEKA